MSGSPKPPPGLRFLVDREETYTLEGTPTEVDEYRMTFTVTDANGDEDELRFTITVTESTGPGGGDSATPPRTVIGREYVETFQGVYILCGITEYSGPTDGALHLLFVNETTVHAKLPNWDGGPIVYQRYTDGWRYDVTGANTARIIITDIAGGDTYTLQKELTFTSATSGAHETRLYVIRYLTSAREMICEQRGAFRILDEPTQWD